MGKVFVSVDRSNRVQFHGTTEGQHGAQGEAQREAFMKNGRAFVMESVEMCPVDHSPRTGEARAFAESKYKDPGVIETYLPSKNIHDGLADARIKLLAGKDAEIAKALAAKTESDLQTARAELELAKVRAELAALKKAQEGK